MKSGERIGYFRENKGFTQKELAERLGYPNTFLYDIEKGKKEPSREFLKKVNEIFGFSSDYILYNGVAAQSEKMKGKFLSKGFKEEGVREIQLYYLAGVYRGGQEEWQRGRRQKLAVHEPEVPYRLLTAAQKELLYNMPEILESGNEVMIDALKANIKVFLEAMRTRKKDNEDKLEGGN